jgi:glycosyltransferase involved in cell wall biosynthesis
VVRASIVIDTYNHERFVREAIDSALAQSYDDVEVIVVDDGSSDATPRIVESYGNEVDSLLKGNGGQASALNAGFARSSGEFVVFLDGDDYLYPSALSNVAEAFVRAGPGAAKVHWPLDVVDEKGEPSGEQFPGRELPEGDFRKHALTHPPPFVLSPPTSGNAWSRAFLASALPMPEQPFRYGADTYLFELAPLFGPVARLSEPQGAYRRHASSGHESRALSTRLGIEVGWYDAIFPVLKEYSERLGLEADERMWRDGSWFHRLARAVEELRAVLPPQATAAVADGGAWGLDDELDGRCLLTFPEEPRRYGSTPVDDEHAVAELEALSNRADYFVLGWPCFWWRESYPRFAAHLRQHLECVSESEQALVYRVG